MKKSVVLCLVAFAIANGVGQASATPLDDAAERYRPYMIEGIGSALAGIKGCASVSPRRIWQERKEPGSRPAPVGSVRRSLLPVLYPSSIR